MSEWKGRRDACPHCKGSGKLTHPAPLTQYQAKLYRFVASSIVANGFAPTFEEIAKYFGYASLATVHEHLSNLERKGYITRSWNEARSIICLVQLGPVAA